jgi:putative cardiolipin synthase
MIGIALLQGCQQLPSLQDRPPSSALTETADTKLGQAITPQANAHPGLSGFVAIENPRDAFAARALLAEAAEKSLDVQYYIWHRDMSGSLLFVALHRAAERGVRVRLLLDDNNSSKETDEVLAALDAHPNIEVRLFNPFLHRGAHGLGYLTDFTRLNRRMHNKSFTADNQVTIVGGRNVGDEYYGASEHTAFVDLDVIGIGPVVRDVSKDFDAYWACGSVYPSNQFLPPPKPEDAAALIKTLTQVKEQPEARRYIDALTRQPFVQDIVARRLPWEWTTIRVLADDPAKGLGQAPDSAVLVAKLKESFGSPKQELQIVSPYFVPTETGTEYLTTLARQGIQISILTNSYAATDVMPVHAGYSKWRKPLLEAGVKLYELKRISESAKMEDHGFTGSSGSSLHAKTMAIDRSRVFIGSFNFDPRSAVHNTEIGFIIDSSTKAQEMNAMFTTKLVEMAYEVRLDAGGELIWIEHKDGVETVHQREPNTGFIRRGSLAFLAWLPIEWLL